VTGLVAIVVSCAIHERIFHKINHGFFGQKLNTPVRPMGFMSDQILVFNAGIDIERLPFPLHAIQQPERDDSHNLGLDMTLRSNENSATGFFLKEGIVRQFPEVLASNMDRGYFCWAPPRIHGRYSYSHWLTFLKFAYPEVVNSDPGAVTSNEIGISVIGGIRAAICSLDSLTGLFAGGDHFAQTEKR
jgi:hypothetical protein